MVVGEAGPEMLAWPARMPSGWGALARREGWVGRRLLAEVGREGQEESSRCARIRLLITWWSGASAARLVVEQRGAPVEVEAAAVDRTEQPILVELGEEEAAAAVRLRSELGI